MDDVRGDFFTAATRHNTSYSLKLQFELEN